MLIEQMDAGLFAFLNQQLVHPAADDLFVFLTKANLSRHIFVIAALFMLVRGGRRGLFALLLALLAVGVADFTASGILKPLVGRIRPCFALEHVRLLIDQSRSFSFASSHAANTAAVATMVWVFFHRGSLQERLFTATMIGYALLVGYSRIYVGVHYPGDVAGGMTIGVLSALIVYLLFTWTTKNAAWLRLPAEKRRS
ncbi:phosphatase PAP2 family protein [Chlorobium phaeovibrioides]|uniref:Phosphatase PAP2 family protein n=2 Tax=Chlorobium phaeovibrioides TaxID=1094 RepID=A0A432AVI8_CHLPH|nr:phosphatase PAP2 family protein [Chlorobium phaeovibrioides]HCD35725.1 phosphatase PAP2 family protein [Chlorobium sp.]KAA6233297.1 phosphatase PAP2 family protein [Chlorobium phaeovibrioides]MWV54477.1 phosphatase PAP2 family protein [Chlorobium phaeovibrioides]QEQ56298.1 phosphatase PAP2 family protein [Chlorobium phaeovibrioides]RTY36704.1 phosphatase PAP2 family protein [Chlorobium phaeovibrioides]